MANIHGLGNVVVEQINAGDRIRLSGVTVFTVTRAAPSNAFGVPSVKLDLVSEDGRTLYYLGVPCCDAVERVHVGPLSL